MTLRTLRRSRPPCLLVTLRIPAGTQRTRIRVEGTTVPRSSSTACYSAPEALGPLIPTVEVPRSIHGHELLLFIPLALFSPLSLFTVLPFHVPGFPTTGGFDRPPPSLSLRRNIGVLPCLGLIDIYSRTRPTYRFCGTVVYLTIIHAVQIVERTLIELLRCG